MTIEIQYVKMPTSEAMSDYTMQRLDKLSEKYDWIIRAQVFFKYENDPKGRGKICEIELSAPGPKIFAVSNEKNYEMAVKNTISDLEKQLKKRKEVFKPYA